MSKITIKQAVNSDTVQILDFSSQPREVHFEQEDKEEFAKKMNSANANQPLSTIVDEPMVWYPDGCGVTIDANLIFASKSEIDTSFSDLNIVRKNFETIVENMKFSGTKSLSFQIKELNESQFEINLNGISFIVPSRHEFHHLSYTSSSCSTLTNNTLYLTLR